MAYLSRSDHNLIIGDAATLPWPVGIGGFMASGAKNQLPLVNDLGALTLRDGSVGRWDGKESFFFDGFDVGGHP